MQFKDLKYIIIALAIPICTAFFFVSSSLASEYFETFDDYGDDYPIKNIINWDKTTTNYPKTTDVVSYSGGYSLTSSNQASAYYDFATSSEVQEFSFYQLCDNKLYSGATFHLYYATSSYINITQSSAGSSFFSWGNYDAENGTSTYNNTAYPSSDDVWYLIHGVRSGDNLLIYIDGTLIATTNFKGESRYFLWTITSSNSLSKSYLDNFYILDNTPTLTDIEWFFPQQDYEVSNELFADWNIIYNLNDSQIGNFNILIIYYTDVNGLTHNDWEVLPNTTGAIQWVMDRTISLPTGETWAWAIITKLTNCTDINSPDCIWSDVAKSDIISFKLNNESDNGTVFDYGLTGFTPATTTNWQDDEDTSWIGKFIRSFVMNIFPLGTAFQLRQVFIDAQGLNRFDPIDINLNQILVDDEWSASGTLISANLITENLPIWNTLFYPWIGNIFYILTFLYLTVNILIIPFNVTEEISLDRKKRDTNFIITETQTGPVKYVNKKYV